MWQSLILVHPTVDIGLTKFTSGLTSLSGVALRFSGEMLREFSKLPQKKNVILLIVVCIVATFPTKVHTTQFAAKCCHLSTLLLHKVPLALLAKTARFHVDIFMACFNSSYKIWLRPTPSLSWWKFTNQPTCHFFSEVKVGKSPFLCWPHGFLLQQDESIYKCCIHKEPHQILPWLLCKAANIVVHTHLIMMIHSTHILVVFSHIFRLIHLYLLLTNLMVCSHNHIRSAVRTENPHLSVIGGSTSVITSWVVPCDLSLNALLYRYRTLQCIMSKIHTGPPRSWTDWQTNTTENITFPHYVAGGKNKDKAMNRTTPENNRHEINRIMGNITAWYSIVSKFSISFS